METDINPSAIAAVLVLMAAASLFTMLSLNQINYIIHGDLYNFGLHFSYRWAMPYWIFSGIIFGLSWINIFTSIVVAWYIFKRSRETLKPQDASEAETSKAVIQPKQEREQGRLTEVSEPQKEEASEPREETETPKEELMEEKVEQLEEPVNITEARDVQDAWRETEADDEEREETEEAPIPQEDADQRQPTL